MSSESNRSDYIILAVLGVVSLACILLMSADQSPPDEPSGFPPARSTRTTDGSGMMAYYMLLQRLDVPVRQSEAPLLSHRLRPSEALFVISPVWPLAEGEVLAMDRWIRQGGLLVCTSDVAEELGYLDTPAGAATTDRRYRQYAMDRSPAPAGTISPEAEPLPLARDVSAVHMREKAAWSKNARPDDPAVSITPLLADSEGARIVSLNIDEGEVVVLADSVFLANGYLGKADNSILAANLASYAVSRSASGKITFDEYHFGARRRETGWTAMAGLLFSTSPGWGILCITAAGMCWLLYKGRRFGARRADSSASRRSKVQYVRAVGATFQAAGAHRVTFAALLAWFKAQCAMRLGLPGHASWQEIADRISHRTAKPVASYLEVFRKGKEAADARALSRRRMVSLLGDLARIESEIIDGNTKSK